MSIHDGSPKIKGPIGAFLDSQKGHDFMVIIVILGVSIAGFALGSMSKTKEPSQVTIQTDPSLVLASKADYVAGKTPKSPASYTVAEKTSSGQVLGVNGAGGEASGSSTSQTNGNTGSLPYVASKKGKKYYPVGCAGAKSLSEANRIYFKDKAEAEAKGYTLSTSCQ